MKVIFTAIFVGPVILFLIVLLTTDFTLLRTFDINIIYNIGVLAIIAIVIPSSNYYSNRTLKKVHAADSLQSRMAKFQTSLIIKLASWEALALFLIVAMMEGASIVILAFFIVTMGVLFLNYPSISNLEKAIQLSSSEVQMLRSSKN
jgi:hypothetical protein